GIESNHRTGESTWRRRVSRRAPPSDSARASTLVTTRILAFWKDACSRCGRSFSRAGAIREQWKGADTGSGIARLAPRAVHAAQARATAAAWPAMTVCSGELKLAG